MDHVFAQLANGTPLELAARQPQMMRPQQIITRQPSAEGRDETDGNCKPWARGTLQSPDHADPDDDSTILRRPMFFQLESLCHVPSYCVAYVASLRRGMFHVVCMTLNLGCSGQPLRTNNKKYRVMTGLRSVDKRGVTTINSIDPLLLPHLVNS